MSLLDNDFYQFTMSHAVWISGDGQIPVRYEFRNRTFSVPLAHRIDLDRLNEEIETRRQMRFTHTEIEVLRNLGYFQPDYLDALNSDFVLPDVNVGSNNGHLVITYEGPWWTAIFWETILLSVVNEMYFEQFPSFFAEGERRLKEKMSYLSARPSLKVVEFGTRRRFSQAWQHSVIEEMMAECPATLVGTSNVMHATHFGLRPVGTMAHQLFMVYTALGFAAGNPSPLRYGIRQVLWRWANTYRKFPEMMTCLPDTYTTKEFIRLASPDDIRPFTAFRQDSGNPEEIGMRLYSYARLISDEKPKLIFSDGLDVRRMSIIEDFFGDAADLTFGWGTNLTNDLGYEPLSIVVKPCAAQHDGWWYPCVKVSDDIEKATGDPETIQKYLGYIV